MRGWQRPPGRPGRRRSRLLGWGTSVPLYRRARCRAGWGGEPVLQALARFWGIGGVGEVAARMCLPARAAAAPKVAGEGEALSGLS